MAALRRKAQRQCGETYTGFSFRAICGESGGVER
jgi:hypothetical protein